MIARMLDRLLAAPAHPFPDAGPPNEAPVERGVYVIQNPEGRAVHVGNTPRGKKGLRQRLNNHLRGASSFSRAYCGGDRALLRGGYSYKYITVPDPRQRALLEALAIGTLCPEHLGTGLLKKESS